MIEDDIDMEEIAKYFLQPGYIFFSEIPHLIHTVLGSCIAVCIWDSRRHCGGINHFIYAKSHENKRSTRYGDISIPYLIKLIIDSGSFVEDLRVHIVGGGQNLNLSAAVGEENIKIADEIINKYGLKVLSHDVGGTTGRKLVFNNVSGEVFVYKGIEVRKEDWYS